MHVVTLFKTGPEYKPEYLYRLAEHIKRHNPDATISCLTDAVLRHPDIRSIRTWLPPKWWGKLFLFEHFKTEPVLYLDIDTVPVDDMEPLVRDTEGFTMLPNVYRLGRVGSGVMSWYGDYSYLGKTFRKRLRKVLTEYRTADKWGDQAFIEHNLGFEPDLFGRECRSYKAECLHGIPEGTRLVYFHGRPRPWQVEKWR